MWRLLLLCCLVVSTTAKCSDAPRGLSKLFCYYKGEKPVEELKLCACTHLIYAGSSRGDDLKRLSTALQDHNSKLKILLRIRAEDKDVEELIKSSVIHGVDVHGAHDVFDRVQVTKKVESMQRTLPTDSIVTMTVPASPELLAKYYDLRSLSKSVSFFSVETDHLTKPENFTYHPSRLSGLWDMLNTDSVVDLVVGLGLAPSKVVVMSPARVLQFTLSNETLSTPGSPTEEKSPTELNRKELCKLLKNGEKWTLERDQDLTAPYAFSGKKWLAFEDTMSMDVKGKYVRIRGLAGMGLSHIDDDEDTECDAGLLQSIEKSLRSQSRAPRGALLSSLEHEILSVPHSSRLVDAVQISPYRINTVVDSDGIIHSLREDTRTEFKCQRQGYFVHPRTCNRFYRCVKFDQLSDEFTVFEFDCPAGLAFDSRYEVCVWPGSLSDGQACPGSSEIAPVPETRFICPEKPGYYADPANCRWFFACLDHGKSPLSAYEFRCPFGLGFDESKLICDWPWLVPGCGNIGKYEFQAFGHGSTILSGGLSADSVNIAAHNSLASGASSDNLIGIQGGIHGFDSGEYEQSGSFQHANVGGYNNIGNHGTSGYVESHGNGYNSAGISGQPQAIIHGSTHGYAGQDGIASGSGELYNNGYGSAGQVLLSTGSNGNEYNKAGQVDFVAKVPSSSSVVHGNGYNSAGQGGYASGSYGNGYGTTGQGYSVEGNQGNAYSGAGHIAVAPKITSSSVVHGNGYNGAGYDSGLYGGRYGTTGQAYSVEGAQGNAYSGSGHVAVAPKITSSSSVVHASAGYVAPASQSHGTIYGSTGNAGIISKNNYASSQLYGNAQSSGNLYGLNSIDYNGVNSGQYIHDDSGEYRHDTSGDYNHDRTGEYFEKSVPYVHVDAGYKHVEGGLFGGGEYEGGNVYGGSQYGKYNSFNVSHGGVYNGLTGSGGSAHVLTAGAINSGLVGKTTLIDTGVKYGGYDVGAVNYKPVAFVQSSTPRVQVQSGFGYSTVAPEVRYTKVEVPQQPIVGVDYHSGLASYNSYSTERTPYVNPLLSFKTVSSTVPSVYSKVVVAPVVPQIHVSSTPRPHVFSGPEYLPPKVTVPVVQTIKYQQPTVQTYVPKYQVSSSIAPIAEVSQNYVQSHNYQSGISSTARPPVFVSSTSKPLIEVKQAYQPSFVSTVNPYVEQQAYQANVQHSYQPIISSPKPYVEVSPNYQANIQHFQPIKISSPKPFVAVSQNYQANVQHAYQPIISTTSRPIAAVSQNYQSPKYVEQTHYHISSTPAPQVQYVQHYQPPKIAPVIAAVKPTEQIHYQVSSTPAPQVQYVQHYQPPKLAPVIATVNQVEQTHYQVSSTPAPQVQYVQHYQPPKLAPVIATVNQAEQTHYQVSSTPAPQVQYVQHYQPPKLAPVISTVNQVEQTHYQVSSTPAPPIQFVQHYQPPKLAPVIATVNQYENTHYQVSSTPAVHVQHYQAPKLAPVVASVKPQFYETQYSYEPPKVNYQTVQHSYQPIQKVSVSTTAKPYVQEVPAYQYSTVKPLVDLSQYTYKPAKIVVPTPKPYVQPTVIYTTPKPVVDLSQYKYQPAQVVVSTPKQYVQPVVHYTTAKPVVDLSQYKYQPAQVVVSTPKPYVQPVVHYTTAKPVVDLSQYKYQPVSTPKPYVQYSTVKPLVDLNQYKYQSQEQYQYQDAKIAVSSTPSHIQYSYQTPKYVSSTVNPYVSVQHSYQPVKIASTPATVFKVSTPAPVVYSPPAQLFTPAPVKVTTYKAPEYLPPKTNVQIGSTGESSFDSFEYKKVEVKPSVGYEKYSQFSEVGEYPVNLLGFGTVGPDAGLVRPTLSTYKVSTAAPVVNYQRVPVKTKPKVAVVTKVNDFNPLLVRKLGAVCSCRSNVVKLRKPKPQNEEYDDDFRIVVDDDYNQYEEAPVVVKKPKITVVSSSLSPIIVPDEDYDSTVKPIIVADVDESRPFDRYGPGGLRERDETLQGTIDCQRVGLFRHPKHCNKFYSCRWDCTKKKFTLHVFNCPVQLSFDPNMGACNWPSQGPACRDDTLLQ